MSDFHQTPSLVILDIERFNLEEYTQQFSVLKVVFC